MRPEGIGSVLWSRGEGENERDLGTERQRGRAYKNNYESGGEKYLENSLLNLDYHTAFECLQ